MDVEISHIKIQSSVQLFPDYDRHVTCFLVMIHHHVQLIRPSSTSHDFSQPKFLTL